ncbi:hypothetical protein BJ878DRAFT_499866 [Calycina marina]|uniref:Macro domain-containing protein n=1 Tax=Calycina marina TaxID=1763456 RepID=A0A9P7Z5T1_9HELO|nr:hypothetical protein BJ878DRAFT_499866 [Calycina marina]
MTIHKVDEIPTISLLYKTKKLEAPANQDAETLIPAPSQSFNDRIGLVRGDITKLEVDVIVNAANQSLLGGGGVDGAIHSASGPDLLKECQTLDGCETGSAKITGAYELPSNKIIHAVGPVYSRRYPEKSEKDLASCYTTSMQLAVENECKSIAFSALSTGIYGYPSQDAAPVAIKAVKDFIESENGDKLEKVIFCTFVQKDVDAYNYWLPRFFPPAENVEPETATTEEGKDDEWEDIEEGESAENGAAEVKIVPELPEVPKTELEPVGSPSPKKQKLEDTTDKKNL